MKKKKKYKHERRVTAVYECPKCGYKVKSYLSSLDCFCGRCGREMIFRKLLRGRRKMNVKNNFS